MASRIWRGLPVNDDGAIKLDADPEAVATESTDRFVRGLPFSADGVRVEISGGGVLVPAPPESGTKVLTSTNGVLSWEDAA